MGLDQQGHLVVRKLVSDMADLAVIQAAKLGPVVLADIVDARGSAASVASDDASGRATPYMLPSTIEPSSEPISQASPFIMSQAAKVAQYSELILKLYFVAATVLTVATVVYPPLATVKTVSFLVGSVWDYADSMGGVMTAKDEWNRAVVSKRATQRKKFFAGVNLGWSAVGMPGLTTWALIVSGLVGAAPAVAAAFLVSMAIYATKESIGAYRAGVKSDTTALLNDRIEKYDILTERLRTDDLSDEMRTSLLNDQLRMQNQAVALYKHLKNENADFDNSGEISRASALQGKDFTPGKSILVDYLIEKQQETRKEKKLQATASVFAAVAALLTGLAVVIPPAGIVAAICFGIAAVLKSREVVQQIRSERRFKKISVRPVFENKSEAEIKEILVRDYLGLKPQDDLKHYVSLNDFNNLADAQCEKLLAESASSPTLFSPAGSASPAAMAMTLTA